MIEFLKISDKLRDEIKEEACGILLGLLEQHVYSQDNRIIPINKVKGHMVDHLCRFYSSRILGEDPGFLVGETLRDVSGLAAKELGYEKRYLEQTSEKGQPLEGRVLDIEVTDEETKRSGNPVYWIRK